METDRVWPRAASLTSRSPRIAAIKASNRDSRRFDPLFTWHRHCDRDSALAECPYQLSESSGCEIDDTLGIGSQWMNGLARRISVKGTTVVDHHGYLARFNLTLLVGVRVCHCDSLPQLCLVGSHRGGHFVWIKTAVRWPFWLRAGHST